MVAPLVVAPELETALITGGVVSAGGGGGGGVELEDAPGTLATNTSLRVVEPQLLVNAANFPSRLIVARGVSQ